MRGEASVQPTSPSVASSHAVVQRADLPHLFEALQRRGYQIVGPTVREGAIIYDEVQSLDDLPIGYTDDQEAGTYRLRRRTDSALFGYNVGPHSWKKLLFVPRLRLWQAQRDGQSFRIESAQEPEPPKYALLGVRACELHAIAIQDQVFMRGPYVDPTYAARRVGLCVIAVNCGQAGGTCFCVSMATGPKAHTGFDLALTEVLDAERHYFVVEVGTPLGAELLGELPHAAAREDELLAAARIVADTAAHMGRTMDTTGIHALLTENPEHPRWDDVAARCLTCTNCTLVCPTCFCSSVEDTTDLTGARAERWRRWDSCFTMDFSYVAGGSVRASARSRYRQWMTHKLATWIDQFGTSGCVGCGRCITWCPVGIDITEEVRAIRETSVPVAPAAEEQ
jgi:sulfhydrogenase subunit beta (sulfur reductase)